MAWCSCPLDRSARAEVAPGMPANGSTLIVLRFCNTSFTESYDLQTAGKSAREIILAARLSQYSLLSVLYTKFVHCPLVLKNEKEAATIDDKQMGIELKDT